MELQITWDIIFVALFLVVFGLALLRPHKFTLRLLLGTYISLIVSEGTALFLEKIMFPFAPALQEIVLGQEMLVFTSIRVIFFTGAMLLFLLNGHYTIGHKRHDHWLVRIVIHVSFALFTSLLISLSLFAFLSGNAIIHVLLGDMASNGWLEQSIIIHPLLQTLGIWVVLPAAGMWLANIFGPKGEE